MRALLLALVLLAGLAASDAPPTGTDCGQVSPVSNQCAGGVISLKHAPRITVDVLGFAGHLRVEVRGFEDAKVFARDYDAAGQALALGGWQDSGRFATGELASVTCTASGLRAVYTDAEHNAGRILLPAPLPAPVGRWHCSVDAS